MNVEHGYLFRCSRANATSLQAIITTFFCEQCWSFGGALLWDVQSAQGRHNLRPIAMVAATSVDIRGDFGHAFDNDNEVRWKRRDDGDYDVLLLTETPPDAARQTQCKLTQIAMFPTVVARTGRTAMFLVVPREVQEKQRRSRLSYKEYRTASGATQLARHMCYWEELVKE